MDAPSIKIMKCQHEPSSVSNGHQESSMSAHGEEDVDRAETETVSESKESTKAPAVPPSSSPSSGKMGISQDALGKATSKTAKLLIRLWTNLMQEFPGTILIWKNKIDTELLNVEVDRDPYIIYKSDAANTYIKLNESCRQGAIAPNGKKGWNEELNDLLRNKAGKLNQLAAKQMLKGIVMKRPNFRLVYHSLQTMIIQKDLLPGIAQTSSLMLMRILLPRLRHTNALAKIGTFNPADWTPLYGEK